MALKRSLVFKLENVASTLLSLMFELEENPTPTKSIERIIINMDKIINIAIASHSGGLSHHILFIVIETSKSYFRLLNILTS